MIPADIGPHPAAPNHYISFGKPEDWQDEDCGRLTVRRVGATGDMLYEPAARIVRDDLPSGESVYPSFLSEWLLTNEDRTRVLEAIITGEPVFIRLLLAGNGLQPQSLWVRGEDEI